MSEDRHYLSVSPSRARTAISNVQLARSPENPEDWAFAARFANREEAFDARNVDVRADLFDALGRRVKTHTFSVGTLRAREAALVGSRVDVRGEIPVRVTLRVMRAEAWRRQLAPVEIRNLRLVRVPYPDYPPLDELIVRGEAYYFGRVPLGFGIARVMLLDGAGRLVDVAGTYSDSPAPGAPMAVEESFTGTGYASVTQAVAFWTADPQ